MRTTILLAGTAALLAAASQAAAHPHVFAEARLEIGVDAERNVEWLRHVWRFDDLFSSTVLFEFDTNRDLVLDAEELETVGSVVHESLSEFNYFQMVTSGGKNVEMEAPERLIANFEDNVLVIAFESRPAQPLSADTAIDFGVYDPTFYTAIDFYEDEMMSVAGKPDNCTATVVRPDPDEALAMNQESLTDAFFNEPGGVDYSRLFATRLELRCGSEG
jgi:ABC-type uncharacterized transport system substrate-binding protein